MLLLLAGYAPTATTGPQHGTLVVSDRLVGSALVSDRLVGSAGVSDRQVGSVEVSDR